MSWNQRRKVVLIWAICAMKEGLRLAQSIFLQPFDEIAIFGCLSRRQKANFGRCKKADSDPSFFGAGRVDSAPST